MAKKSPRANMALYEGLFKEKRRFCLIYYHAVKYIEAQFEALYSKLFLSFNHAIVGRFFYFKVRKFEKSYLSSMTMKVWSVWTKNKQIYCVGWFRFIKSCWRNKKNFEIWPLEKLAWGKEHINLFKNLWES